MYKKTHKSSVRIIGGTWRRRKILFPRELGLRPTGDRIRETLFNWLQPNIVDANCLDLFAGSGSLGIEAISNGANNCMFVEQNQELNFYLKNNCDDLGITDKSEILRQSAENFVRRVKDKKFDIIFFDPPFNKNYVSTLVPKIIDRFSKQGTLIYIENRTSDEKYNFDALELIKETVSGESNGKLYRVSL